MEFSLDSMVKYPGRNYSQPKKKNSNLTLRVFLFYKKESNQIIQMTEQADLAIGINRLYLRTNIIISICLLMFGKKNLRVLICFLPIFCCALYDEW